MKENNIERIMGIYCLFNKETKVYDSFMISFDDSEAKDFYVEQIALIAHDLASKGDTKRYDQLVSRFTESCVMRLATFDKVLGVFNNEQVVLLDYISEQNIIDYFNARDELQTKFKKVSDNVNGKSS